MWRAEVQDRPWILHLNECSEGETRLLFEASATVLDIAVEGMHFFVPLRIDANVMRALDTFQIGGEIGVSVRGECSRCLEPAEKSVQATMNLLLQRKEISSEELAAVVDEQIEILRPATDSFDMQGAIREEVLLALPLALCCRDDCKGLCDTCGTNLNTVVCACTSEMTDPRWAELGKLDFN